MTDFLAVEIEAYRPGASGAARYALGLTGVGMPPATFAPMESTAVLRASDAGYRTRSGDAGGLQVYPPTMNAASDAIERALNLEPGRSAAAWSAGGVELSNMEGDFDSIASTYNSDRRTARVLYGRRTFDAARGIEVDPPRSTLQTVFAGLAQPWSLGEDSLNVPLRDPSYWLERPLLVETYAGTGGYQGTPDMRGRPVPVLRGGRAGNPVLNIEPLLIDPVNIVYQVSNRYGAVYAVYTGGDTNMTRAADTLDVYAGSCPPGQYRVSSRADGLYIQLGTKITNNWALTCDASGKFTANNAAATAARVVQHLLLVDMALPSALLHTASFDQVDAALPYAAGDYWPEAIDAVDAIGPMLAAMGAQLVPTRGGQLRLVLLRALAPGTLPAAYLNPSNVITATPRALPQGLSPPPYRWQATYAKNYTVQTSNLDPDVVGTARQGVLAQANQTAAWVSPDLQLAYRNPSDPAPVQTRCLVQANAESLVSVWGALWGVQRRLFDLRVDFDAGLARDIGDIVSITYPIGDLRSGRLGQIVGERIEPSERTMTLTVLI